MAARLPRTARGVPGRTGSVRWRAVSPACHVPVRAALARLLLIVVAFTAGMTVLAASVPAGVPVAGAAARPAAGRTAAGQAARRYARPPVASTPVSHTPPRTARPARSPSRPEVITLAAGDTLWGLAIRCHTTVTALQDLNGLGTSTLIYARAAFQVPALNHPAPLARPTAGQRRASASDAARAIAFARAQLGRPYIWGGTGPAGFDCSGLVMRAWQADGVQLPRTTYEQVNAGTRIARGQLTPGDLVFSNDTGHVQMYLGGGQVIQAPHTGASVDITSLPPPGLVDAYVRISPPAI